MSGPRPANADERFLQILILLVTQPLLQGASSPTALAEQPADSGPWSRIQIEGSSSQPVIAGNLLYIGTADGTVRAIALQTGSERWRFQPGEPPSFRMVDEPDKLSANLWPEEGNGSSHIAATPLVVDGTVYVGSMNQHFYALDAATGELRWTFDAGGGINEPAVLRNGAVCFASNRHLFALDPRNGDVLWKFDPWTSDAEDPSTLRKDGVLHCVESDGVFYLANDVKHDTENDSRDAALLWAVDAARGVEQWRLQLDSKGISRPTVSGNVVFVSVFHTEMQKQPARNRRTLSTISFSGQSQLHAIERESGSIRWTFSARDFRGSSAALVGHSSVFYATETELYNIDPITGESRWQLDGEITSRNLHLGDHLLFLRGTSFKKKTLVALNPKDGKEIWSRHLGPNAWIWCVAHGKLYVAVEDEMLAISVDTGATEWTFKTGKSQGNYAQYSCSPTIHGETIFLVTRTNVIMGEQAIRGHVYRFDPKLSSASNRPH